MILAMVLMAVTSYLIGCANFAIIVSKLLYHKDIRDYGSGNAGMTNIARTFGKFPAVLVTIGDFAKGAIALLLGHLLAMTIGGFTEFPFYGEYIVAFFVMMGHCFPVFYGFRGGKGRKDDDFFRQRHLLRLYERERRARPSVGKVFFGHSPFRQMRRRVH